MKRILLFLFVSMIGITGTLKAQKWSELSNEQKSMKAQAFRDDNQNYLKNTLGLTKEQMDDVDNVNVCYLSTLDRIDRYGKDDAAKEKYAKSVTAARSAQLDAIMGVDKRKQFSEYVKGKLKKAGVPVE